MGIPIRNTQNNLKTSQYFRNHPDNRCRSQPSPNRAGALLGLRLTPVIFSIKRIIICSLLLYHNSGSLFVLLDNMIELAERNCHYKSDKQ